MDKITWKYIKPVDDESRFADFWEEHDISLSEEMKKCIINNNGGRPSINVFNTENHNGYVFQSLLSYNKTDMCNIYDLYPSLFENTALFPIGLESAGNIICYDQNSKAYVLWNHENNSLEKICMDIEK